MSNPHTISLKATYVVYRNTYTPGATRDWTVAAVVAGFAKAANMAEQIAVDETVEAAVVKGGATCEFDTATVYRPCDECCGARYMDYTSGWNTNAPHTTRRACDTCDGEGYAVDEEVSVLDHDLTPDNIYPMERAS